MLALERENHLMTKTDQVNYFMQKPVVWTGQWTCCKSHAQRVKIYVKLLTKTDRIHRKSSAYYYCEYLYIVVIFKHKICHRASNMINDQ